MTEPTPLVPAAERAFYVEEFRDRTLVVAVDARDLLDAADALGAVAGSLRDAAARLVLVVGGAEESADQGGDLDLSALGGGVPTVALPPVGAAAAVDLDWVAELWRTASASGAVAVAVPAGRRSVDAAELAASTRAAKLVITDQDGGWGRPARSFADVSTHRDAYHAQLADRQGGAVVAALETALAGGVGSVNLCRATDLDRELFTFDGAGTLFTSGGYVEVVPLGLDDLAAVQDLVEQGIADGLLRPRSAHEIARLAVTGLGAKVVGSGHLAGIVGLETEPYRAERLGEVAALATVSRFSGAGSGGLLVDGLVDRARALGLRAVFAVTVSDSAAAFFARRGFVEVDREAVPAVKWDGYDPDRLSSARVFWRDTAPPDLGF